MIRYLVRTEAKHMATDFTFEVSVGRDGIPRAERTLERAHARVRELESKLSEFLPESEVHRFNHASAGAEWQISPEFSDLFRTSARIAAQTGFAFDPTFRSQDGFRLEDRVGLSEDRRRLKKLLPGVSIGFGAIGKGYALDQVRALLESEGFFDFRLNAGGSSQVLSGSPEFGGAWDLSWAWEKDAEGRYAGQVLRPSRDRVWSIGVSGELEQGAHIRGAGGLKSAWVACDSAAEADALSTALFAAGWEAGYPKIADPLKRPAAAAIDREGMPYWNGFFEEGFGPIRSSK